MVIEPRIPGHEAKLYRSDIAADYVEGWSAVTEEHLGVYEEQGFIVVRGGLDSELVLAAKTELEAMTVADDPGCTEIYYEGTITDHITALNGMRATARGSGTQNLALGVESDHMPAIDPTIRAGCVRKFQGFVEQHPVLRATAYHPKLLALVSKFARAPVRLFQDMAMIKPAGGREKPWHQDHAYFNFPQDTRIVGVWIALGEVNTENGCMFVLPGAHRSGPRIHFRRRDWQICDTDIINEQQMAIPMGPGDIMIFDHMLPHGTPTNMTTNHRWALQYHYVPLEATIVGDDVRLAAFGSEGKNVTC